MKFIFIIKFIYIFYNKLIKKYLKNKTIYKNKNDV